MQRIVELADRTGLGPDELSNNRVVSYGEIVHPDDRDWLWDKCQASLDGHTPCRNEYRIVDKSGATRWVFEQASGNFAPDGTLLCIDGFIQDITERKRAEEEQHKLAALVANSNEFIGLAQLDGRITFLNPAAARMAGVDRMEDITATTILDYVPQEDHERVRSEILPRVFDAGQWHGELVLRNFEMRRLIPLDFSGFVVRDLRTGDPQFLACVGRDVTERKQAEAALRVSEERLRLALDAAQMGTFDWDMSNNYITWSRWHEELWGFGPGEFAGTYESFAERVHPDDLSGINAEVERCIAARERFAREYRVVWPDRSERWVAGTGEFEFDDRGRPVRMRGVVVEITDRKRAEKELRDSKREIESAHALLQALSRRLIEAQENERQRIARELHDEFGQLLATLGFHLHAMRAATGPDLAARLNDCLGIVQRAGEQVRNLSQGLRPPMLELLGLEAALRWLADCYQRGDECRVEFTGRIERADLPRDAAIACFRVVQEALTNVTRHANARHVHVEICEYEHDLEVLVRDDGIGFDADASLRGAVEKQKFGLVGMHERIALLQGRIAIDSAPGHGTAIRVRFPLAGMQSSP